MASSPIGLDANYPLSTSIPATPGQSDFLRWKKNWVSEGIMRGDLNSLAVTQRGAGANMSVDIDTGRGINRGVFWELGTLTNLTIPANSSGLDRIDLLVVRLDASAPRCYLVLIPGTPAAPPAAPSPVNTVDVNGVPVVNDTYVAQILVRNGTSSIITSDITDRRQYLTGYGFEYGGTVASATTLMPPYGRMVQIDVSGTTSITAILIPAAGYILAMRFTSSGCRVVHNGGTIVLEGSRDYLSTAGGSLTLLSTGTSWIELSRSKERATQNLIVASPSNATGEIGLIAMTTAHLPTGIPDANLNTDVARENYLVNPGFEIWQRGNGAFTANAAYLADRWFIALSTSTLSVSRDSSNQDSGSRYCAAVTYTHLSNSQIKQSIENFHAFRGKTVTFAIRVKGSVNGGVRVAIDDGVGGTIGTSHTGSGAYETLYVTRTIDAAATAVTVYPEFLASGTYYLDNATLCLGAVRLDYKPLTAAEDLARCLRYYELLGAQQLGDTGTGALILAGFTSGTAITIYETFMYAAKKALADPTTTKNGTWSVTNTGGTQPSIAADDSTCVRVQVTSAAAAGEILAQANAANTNVSVEANNP